MWGSDSLGGGSSEDRVWVRTGAAREGFLEVGTQDGLIDPRFPLFPQAKHHHLLGREQECSSSQLGEQCF